ncbi:MAG: hypothetical protein ACKVOR_11390 [Flavobacteriales bacterium]
MIITAFAWLAAMYGAQAQQSDAGYVRRPASLEQMLLNKRSTEIHANVQPAAGIEPGLIQLSDSAIKARNTSVTFGIRPLAWLAAGATLSPKTDGMGQVISGIEATWHVRKHWEGSVGYTISGMRPPAYIRLFADSTNILPGAGFATRSGNDFYTSHFTYGHVGYTAKKFFHFELGKRKHFWGDGYRSLILSDVANAFPYIRITTKFWRVKYTNLWAQMRQTNEAYQPKDARIKYTAMHALSWNVSKTLNWSIYEMVVWQDRDTNSKRSLDINYLNPIIFYRPVEYAQGSPDNVILGTSLRYSPSEKVQLYGQMVIDEFYLSKWRNNSRWWANKMGAQLGIKTFDLFTKGFHLQTEINCVRPFTYTHGSPLQSWTHMQQPLAHPMGANFVEWLLYLRYENDDWNISEQFSWAAYGHDRDEDGDGTLDNLGGDIFRSYHNPFRQYDNDLLQGIKSTFHFHQFTLSRKMGVHKQWEIFAQHTMRFEKNEIQTTLDHFATIGLRLNGMLQPQQDF